MKNKINNTIARMPSDVTSAGRAWLYRQKRASKPLSFPLVSRGLGGFSTNFHILDRGYTGHEHLLEHGIINMNGRIYDTVVA